MILYKATGTNMKLQNTNTLSLDKIPWKFNRKQRKDCDI